MGSGFSVTFEKNSFESQSIGGPVWGWIISIIKKILPVSSDACSMSPERMGLASSRSQLLL